MPITNRFQAEVHGKLQRGKLYMRFFLRFCNFWQHSNLYEVRWISASAMFGTVWTYFLCAILTVPSFTATVRGCMHQENPKLTQASLKFLNVYLSCLLPIM